MNMKISVIINTFNRAAYLKTTLNSLRYQTYDDFEVIVVNGPSTDNTESLLDQYSGFIKKRDCPVKNLSTSRNIGIKSAQGEAVAFLDDDAVPDQFWLENIVACFNEGNCSILGGFVLDNSGYRFQSRYILVDRFANSTELNDFNVSQRLFCFPGARQFLTPMGCNVAFLRRDLVAAGGFDEQYDYFLDETDVVARMMDMGFVTRIDPSTIVYHKFAPSEIRKEKWPLDWTSIVKNKLYFICANNFGNVNLLASEKMVKQFVESVVNESRAKQSVGLLTKAEAAACIATAKDGIEKGKENVQSNLHARIPEKDFFQNADPFLRYKKIKRTRSPLVACLLSPAYPPTSTDGIPRYTKTLAEGLAQRGCVVHVITLEGTSNTVDFENGVWIHRMGGKIDAAPDSYVDLPFALREEIARYRSEVLRIDGAIHHVDIVQGPIWDIAPLDLLLHSKLVVGVFMCTTFAIKKAFEPDWYKANKTTVDTIIQYEKSAIRNACFLNFDSEALYDLCLNIYGGEISGVPHRIVHLGAPEVDRGEVNAKRGDALNILFVGRLEERKGIDIVLNAIPELVSEFPNVEFKIVGRNDIALENGRTYMSNFLDEHDGESVLKNVKFLGYVPDETLKDLYKSCDIFVAPSRYESFGQMLIEAMAYGKPIISTAIGGITEVLGTPAAGLLIAQGDARAFRAQLRSLIVDSEKRRELGIAARKRYEREFSDSVMCAATEDFFHELAEGQSLN